MVHASATIEEAASCGCFGCCGPFMDPLNKQILVKHQQLIVTHNSIFCILGKQFLDSRLIIGFRIFRVKSHTRNPNNISCGYLRFQVDHQSFHRWCHWSSPQHQTAAFDICEGLRATAWRYPTSRLSSMHPGESLASYQPWHWIEGL